MSLAKFEREVFGNRVGHHDEIWFPKWVRRYAMNFPGGLVDDLPVNRNSVIKFSQSLLNNGAPAWQRHQAVRSLECYRDLVLQRTEPDLSDVIQTLAGKDHFGSDTWGCVDARWSSVDLPQAKRWRCSAALLPSVVFLTGLHRFIRPPSGRVKEDVVVQRLETGTIS